MRPTKIWQRNIYVRAYKENFAEEVFEQACSDPEGDGTDMGFDEEIITKGFCKDFFTEVPPFITCSLVIGDDIQELEYWEACRLKLLQMETEDRYRFLNKFLVKDLMERIYER